MRDPTRGSVATVLNEIPQQCKLGIEIRQRNIPMHEQVEGACELLGLDPLYVANEGIFIAMVSPEVSGEVVKILREMTRNEAPNVIGEVTTQHAGQVVLAGTVGGKRVLYLLTGEQLPRIC